MVLQDHRLRPAAAGRPGRRWRPPGRTRSGHASATGSAAPRAPTSTSRSSDRYEPLTGLHDPARHAVRRDVHGGRGRRGAGRRSCVPTSSARPWRPTWSRSARSPTSTGWPPTGPRPACSWACTRSTRVTGARIPVYAADYVLADYGTGAIMAVPGQDQRDWDFAAAFDLPIVRTVAAARGLRGGRRGVHRRRRRRSTPPTTRSPWTAWTSTRPKSTHHRLAGGRGRRAGARSTSGCATGCCAGSATGAPRSRSCTARSCGEVAVPEDQLPVELPELGGADLKPKGVSPLARGRGVGQRRLPAVRRPGEARHRHDGHLRRLVVVLLALLLAARRHPGRSTREPVRDLGPADQYVGGVEHAVLHLLYSPVLHQGAARHGPGRLRRAVLGELITRARSSTRAAG